VFFTEDGDEVRCPIAAAEDALRWPAEAYKGFFVNETLVAVFPPKHSTLTITETSPPIRGAGSGQKEAMLENGLKVKVNMLCDVGDKVRIDTETMEFKERIAK
jgi:elongation factor P